MLDDWSSIPGSNTPPSKLGATTDLVVGVTTAEPPPNGGGTHTLGARTLRATTDGVIGFFTNQAGFTPIVAGKGGEITAALMKRGSAAPFLFFGLTSPDVVDNAYVLGLSEAGYLTLSRGPLSSGVPEAGYIRRAAAPVPEGSWLHVRFTVVVNTSNDVCLRVRTSDLSTSPVSAPVWLDHPELDDFIDDRLGANAMLAGVGGLPILSGYVGFGARLRGTGARAHFDRLTCARGL